MSIGAGDMSDETTTTTETTTETPAEKARKAPTIYPIKLCRVVDGALHPIKGAPEFNEQRFAVAWIRDNHKPNETYTTARIGPIVRAVTTLEEVT